MIQILKDGVLGSLLSVWNIARIIIPIMILLQILKDYGLLDKITRKFYFLARIFKISDESILSVLVGVIFGLAYGAGVIIQSARDGNLDGRDLFLVTVFLAACHAVFEDTLLFMAVGANGFLLLVFRFGAAFALTFLLSRHEKIFAKSKLKK